MIQHREFKGLIGFLAVAAFAACDRDRDFGPTSAEPNDPARLEPAESARAYQTEGRKPGIVRPGAGDEPHFAEQVEKKDREAEGEFVSALADFDGAVELKETAAGVVIKLEISGAPPGLRALTIHEQEDCSNLDQESMGLHFNPKQSSHGLPASPEHHLGDLGNIKVEPDGTAELTITVAEANLKPKDPVTLINRSIVVHERADDGKGTDGHSGKAIACAPIRDT